MELRAQERQLQSLRKELSADDNRVGGDVYNGIRHLEPLVERLQADFNRDFMPQHGQRQLISPRSFFTGPIFHVKSRAAPRASSVEVPLATAPAAYPRFVGPELRQDDGLVFMALLNLCRDYRLGKQTCFHPVEMAAALWGGGNGKQVERLRRSIQRLQRSTVEFVDLTVQFVQRFDHPRNAEWCVGLDRDIVQLFNRESHTWLELSVRSQLREGLATWLYGYVCSQQRLIPTPISELHRRCGSDAKVKAFREALLAALQQLAESGVIDGGWFLKHERVHWMKPRRPEPAVKPTAKSPKPASTEPVQASLLP
jgi:hypothetical protein